MTTDTMFRRLTEEEVGSRPTVAADAWKAIVPVPTDGTALTNTIIMKWVRPGYAFTTGWRYLDADGQLLGCVVRYDRVGEGGQSEKEVVPITFCERPDGKREWRKKSWNFPRPLYGLDRLARAPNAPVMVVEGEKVADAAQKRFPDYVAVTSPGGSNAAGKADWSPLNGRKVTIWPDNDEPGQKYADAVAHLASDAGAASVAIVQVPSSLPQKWDLADPAPIGIAQGILAELLVNAREFGGWPSPTPIRTSLPFVEPFLPEMLPKCLRDYVYDVADRQQSVPDFVAVAALCGIATIIGNRVRIAPKQNDDWEVVPNLWGAIIGPPSAMKSPAMQAALSPIYALQDEMRTAWQSAIVEADVEGVLSSLDIKEAKKKAAKAIKDGDREAARSLLSEATPGAEDGSSCPRLLVNDATVEKLGELLNENPRGLLLIRDELAGFLARMESEEFASERAFYLEAYNGAGSFTYDRIGRGTVHIASCTLSLVGGVQPSRIAPMVRAAVAGAANDGLIQRLQLAVWPDSRSGWQWVDRFPDRAAREGYERVFRALDQLQLGSPEKPAVLRFSPVAQQLFREWMVEIHAEARSGTLSPVLESHLLKMPKTVASIALLVELIDGGRFEVGEQSTLRALGWAEYLRSHADRLYAAGNTMVEDGARLVIERRHMLPQEFSVRDIYKKDWAGLSEREVACAAVELLVSTHHCRPIERHSQGVAGRPSETFRWNPALGGQ